MIFGVALAGRTVAKNDVQSRCIISNNTLFFKKGDGVPLEPRLLMTPTTASALVGYC